MTTRLPSIWPSTLAFSPRIKVCSEIILPFTLPSMRNVPVICSVPSSVTPWSINPVHSSLLPPFELPGHFHAILGILVSHCSESVEQVKEPCAKNPPHVSNPRLIERTVELAQASTGQFSCPFTSSGDRRALPIGYRRKIQVRADRGEPWYARAGKSWCRGGAAALRAPREYWDRDASHLFPCCRVHGATRGVRSGEPSIRRGMRVARSACAAGDREL